MRSDCGTYTDHCKQKMIEEVSRKCVRIVSIWIKEARINEVGAYIDYAWKIHLRCRPIHVYLSRGSAK